GGYPDEYLDGLRKIFNYYTSNSRTDSYTLERIEVLRGPSSMLYGQGTTGGVINMVSKRPLEEAQGEVGVQFGSFARKQVQADLTGPLTADGQWLYRLVALARDADTQVDYVRDDRSLLAPSLTWRPSPATSLTLQALWQRDRTGSTSQFFPWEGVILPNPNGPLPDNRFIGEPGYDRYDTDRTTFGWLFEHRFNEQWAFRQNVRFTENEVDYFSHYGDSFTTPGGWHGDPVNKRLLGRFGFGDVNRVRMLATDQHVEGDVVTGSVKHKLLIGLDAMRFKQTGETGGDAPTYDPYFGTLPSIDAYNPVYGNFTPFTLFDKGRSQQRQVGLYLQDQMKFDERWVVVAGLRHDRATSQPAADAPDETTSANTPRLGFMVLADGWSPYVSYSESFTPLANRSVQGGTGFQSFKPLRGKQWEGGVKVQPPGIEGLGFSALVYDLKEQNQIVETAPNVFEQLNETWARGAELEANVRLGAGIDLIASYTYTKVDPQLENVPRNIASLWGKWSLGAVGLPGFSVGAGWRYWSAYADGDAPEVPAVNLLDLMAAWESQHWRLALNINNATDKSYVSTCLSRGDCWWGARRNVVASATYRW
ncbi:MAG TPA: TonB-dependent siderophore receptor, partial [Burkholderiaceae bacterium]|nr:TonB-dependent siderophore receptor [Burkholderiaceae bacterium]